jgi:hypothetical protein
MLTHRWPLERGPEGYEMFKKKTDGCMRVVFDPRRRTRVHAVVFDPRMG